MNTAQRKALAWEALQEGVRHGADSLPADTGAARRAF